MSGRTDTLEQRIRARATALGFVRCGFARAEPLPHDDVLQTWLDRSMDGSMAYLRRTRQQRADPRGLLPEARSAIVVAASYRGPQPDARREPPARGKIAAYARGMDYHVILRQRLEKLERWLHTQVGEPFVARIAVDTAPLLERELAMAAGLGFIGKNTLLITPGVGSYTLLGSLLTSLELLPDSAPKPRCGSCDLCLKACPTQAFPGAFTLDARRCISYLTIEHHTPIDPGLHPQMDGWIFGCDVCQDVCPYNRLPRHAQSVGDAELAPERAAVDLPLDALLPLRSGDYRRLVKGRALRRTPRHALIRNAAIAAGGVRGDDPDLDAHLARLATHPDARIAEPARHAIQRRRSR